MKRICIIGIALAAVFAFSAVAVGTASASDLLFKTSSTPKFPFNALGVTTTPSELTTLGGLSIKCARTHVLVLITDAHLLLAHVTFNSCRHNILGGGPCKGKQVGEKTEEIKILLEGHLGLAHKGTNLKIPAVLLLLPGGKFEFECTVSGIASKVVVTGSVIGELIGKLNEPLSALGIIFKAESTGMQELTLFLLSKLTKEEVMTGQVLSSEVLGKIEESSQTTGEIVLNPLVAGQTVELEEKV
jgi:hypothetical protein